MSPSSSELVAMTVAAQVDPSLAPSAADRSSESATVIQSLLDDHTVIQSLLDDHTELRELVVRLRRLCLALSGNQGLADPDAAVLIEEFAFLLIAHFAAEQGSEFFENRLRDQPRMLKRVERLQFEHGAIAAALGQLLEFCQRGPSGPELSICLTHILDMFDAHERAEKAIMQELVLLDEGGYGE